MRSPRQRLAILSGRSGNITSNGSSFLIARSELWSARWKRISSVRRPADALDAGLRLAAAFDGAMRSPSIAGLIRTLMRENPRAVSHARREDREDP
jgi:hypothetical protein